MCDEDLSSVSTAGTLIAQGFEDGLKNLPVLYHHELSGFKGPHHLDKLCLGDFNLTLSKR